MSCEQAIDIAKTIYAIEITYPSNGNTYRGTLLLNEEQRHLAELFGF